jgi:hypothetical protein
MSSNAVIFCHVWKPELLEGPLPAKKHLSLFDTPYTPSSFSEKAVLWSMLSSIVGGCVLTVLTGSDLLFERPNSDLSISNGLSATWI